MARQAPSIERRTPNIELNWRDDLRVVPFREAHAPSRAGFGAVAETLSLIPFQKVRDRDGAVTSTRGGCVSHLSTND